MIPSASGAEPGPPFSCDSQAGSEQSAPSTIESGAVGAVRIEVLEGGALTIESMGGTLGEVAVALGSALGRTLVVDARVSSLRTSLYLDHVSLEGALDLLKVEYGIQSSELDGALLLESLDTFQQRIWVAEPTELSRRLFSVPKGIPASHAALAYCEHVAGVRGQATVVGGRVLVEDRADRLAAFEVLVAEMGSP